MNILNIATFIACFILFLVSTIALCIDKVVKSKYFDLWIALFFIGTIGWLAIILYSRLG